MIFKNVCLTLKCMVRILAGKHFHENIFQTSFGQVSLQYVSSMSCKTYGKCCYDVLQTMVS